MGRKKKVVVDEPKKEVTVTNSDSSFEYAGKINVTLKKGNKTYFTKQFKNKGRWPLFYFLNMCLKGDYSKASLYRPKYIDAFGNTSWENQVPPNITDDDLTDVTIDKYFKTENRVTVTSYPYLSVPDAKAELKSGSTYLNIGTSNITYKFNIPFTQIISDKPINAFALYALPAQGNGREALSDVSNPCAFFFIINDQGKVVNLIEELDGSFVSDDYNLYIEWTLSVSNTARQEANE